MRRTASEVIRELEMRVARLERQANNKYKLTPEVRAKLIKEFGEPESESPSQMEWRYPRVGDPNSASLRIREDLQDKGIQTWGVWAEGGYLTIDFKD